MRETTSWRVAVVSVLALLLGGALFFRLFEKQVIEHDRYAEAAKAQSTNERVVPAERGKIFAKDKDGGLFPLAVSEWQYDLEISPREVPNKENLARFLSKDIRGVSSRQILQQIDNDKVYVPPVVKGLAVTLAEKITAQKYAGVYLTKRLVRVFPEGASLAPQAIGFVDSSAEGKYGIEAVYDKTLRGKVGFEFATRDSLGRLIDLIGGKTSTEGKDLVLTLDHNLQFVVESELQSAIKEYKADSGEVVVMDPNTGAVLAVAGAPKFDPNHYSKLTGDDQYKFLLSAASDEYEPGSVFKPITMAAALELKLVKPTTSNYFGASVRVLGKKIVNALGDGFGQETMAQVLENSDNVAMVWVSQKLGATNERKYFDKFGFGKQSGIDVVGESAGNLPESSEWNDLLLANAAFGQGIAVNLFQLATAYSVIANGGNLVTPHLAEKAMSGEKAELFNFKTRGRVISTKTAAEVRKMLVGVVVRGHGQRAAVAGVKVGGKTGTAQVPDPRGGYYKTRHVGTFAGLFPADKPKFVMVVRLDNPKTVNFAESSAAPTFGKIATWMANYFQLR